MKNMMKENSSERDKRLKKLKKLEFDKRSEEIMLEVLLKQKESNRISELINESRKRIKIFDNLIQALNHKSQKNHRNLVQGVGWS